MSEEIEVLEKILQNLIYEKAIIHKDNSLLTANEFFKKKLTPDFTNELLVKIKDDKKPFLEYMEETLKKNFIKELNKPLTDEIKKDLMSYLSQIKLRDVVNIKRDTLTLISNAFKKRELKDSSGNIVDHQNEVYKQPFKKSVYRLYYKGKSLENILADREISLVDFIKSHGELSLKEYAELQFLIEEFGDISFLNEVSDIRSLSEKQKLLLFKIQNFISKLDLSSKKRKRARKLMSDILKASQNDKVIVVLAEGQGFYFIASHLKGNRYIIDHTKISSELLLSQIENALREEGASIAVIEKTNNGLISYGLTTKNNNLEQLGDEDIALITKELTNSNIEDIFSNLNNINPIRPPQEIINER